VRFRVGRAQFFEGTPGQPTSVPLLVVTEVQAGLSGSAGVFTLSPHRAAWALTRLLSEAAPVYRSSSKTSLIHA
jgi:hypothetical protein